MGHTPGKWDYFTKFEGDGEDQKMVKEDDGTARMRFIYSESGQGFAHTVGLSPDVDIANARLICASPDLLDVLKRLVAHPMINHDDIRDLDELIEEARDTIARAEGTK